VVGIAALQGLLLWWLSGTMTDRTWPATGSVWYTPFMLNAVFLAPIIYGLSEWTSQPRTWLCVALLALVLLAAGLHQEINLNVLPYAAENTRFSPFPLFLIVFVFLFHAMPFIQVFLETGRWTPDYSLLFSRTWRNALQLALAGLFAGVFWVLLMLGASLFDMISIPFPKVLLSDDPRFALLVAAIAYGAGFHMAGSAERLLLALRQQVLALLKWLALVATVILVLFAMALLVQAPQLMAEHKHVVRASWLLWVTVITVYLYNAGFQDGQVNEPYPPFLGKLLRYATPLLVLISGMALYALIVRIDAYGFTVPRIWALLVSLLTIAYAVSYSAAAFRAGPWMAGMGRANVAVALILLGALALMLSPLLTPERWAARSIAARLSADPAAMTSGVFRTLRFDSGVYGVERLQRMSAASDVNPGLRAAARSVLAATERYKWTGIPKPIVDLDALVFEILPAGTVVDSQLREQIAEPMRTEVSNFSYAYSDPDAERPGQPAPALDALGNLHIRPSECTAAAPCPVLFIDLDGDLKPEAVVMRSGTAEAYRHVAGGWESVALLPVGKRRGDEVLQKTLRRELAAGQFSAFDPGWKGLTIGDRHWMVLQKH
jgi:hypothetical protein